MSNSDIFTSIKLAKKFGENFLVFGNTESNNIYLLVVPLDLVKCSEFTLLKLINYLSYLYNTHAIDWSRLTLLPDLPHYDPDKPSQSLNMDTYDDYYLKEISRSNNSEWSTWPAIEDEILNYGITQEIIRPLIAGNELQVFPSLYDDKDCFDFFHNYELNSKNNFIYFKNRKHFTYFYLPPGTESYFFDFGEMINYHPETNTFARSYYRLIEDKIYLEHVISFYNPDLKIINKELNDIGFKSFSSIHEWIASWPEIQNHLAQFFYSNLPSTTLTKKTNDGFEIYYDPMTNRMLFSKNKKAIKLIYPNLVKENLLSLDPHNHEEGRAKFITLTQWFEKKCF